MTTKLSILNALIGAALAAGCSNAAIEDGGRTPDVGPGSGAATDVADLGNVSCGNAASLVTSDGMCNNVPFPSARIPFTTGLGSAPTFTGGALIDGLYAAVRAEGWNTGSGYGRQMGLVIADGGKTMLWFGQTLSADGSGDVDAGTASLVWLRGNYTLSLTSSNTLALATSCAAGTTTAPTALLFTATATDPPQMLLANPGVKDPTTAVTTYERQGCP
jgi:hypothetical protein